MTLKYEPAWESHMLKQQKENDKFKGMTVEQRQRLYERMCGGKKQFFTKKECETQMKVVMSMSEVDKDMVAYKCLFCGAWHYGHRPGCNRPDSNKTSEGSDGSGDS